MKLFKKLKKGFTLVELIVVIAVIAILAATSVGVYFGVTESAKKSNDQTVTNQMNKALVLDATVNGAPKTVTEVLDVLEENGFNVTKMSPFQDGAYYVWDSVDNKMILLDKDNVVQFPADETVGADKESYFTFVANKAERTKYAEYSHYLEDNYVGDEDEVFTTGVDVGNNYGKDVIYSGTATVTIRTNNGDLTVKSGTVNHYGEANFLKVEAGAKYNEYGTVVGNLDTIPAIPDSEISSYQSVTTENELKSALLNGGKIIIDADISVSKDTSELTVFGVTKDTEINLNGHNISGTIAMPTGVNKSNELFKVYKNATLTLSGYGVISYGQTVNNSGWNSYNNVITVRSGTLNLEDAVIIRNIGGTDMAFAVEVNNTEAVSTLNVNGGLIESVDYRAIRGYCNNVDAPTHNGSANVNVTNGVIKSMKNCAIWFQNPNSNQNSGNLTITGGKFITGDRDALNIGSSTNIHVNVTGGTFIKNGVDVSSQYVK